MTEEKKEKKEKKDWSGRILVVGFCDIQSTTILTNDSYYHRQSNFEALQVFSSIPKVHYVTIIRASRESIMAKWWFVFNHLPKQRHRLTGRSKHGIIVV